MGSRGEVRAGLGVGGSEGKRAWIGWMVNRGGRLLEMSRSWVGIVAGRRCLYRSVQSR